MNKSFKISDQEYQLYIKYFNLIKNEKLLHSANTRIENYVNSNTMKYMDYFLNSCLQSYFDIFFLDFLSKFFFRRSIIRLKLNMILALQEADYDNFNKMINIWNYGESFTYFKDYWLMLTRDHGRVIKAKKKNIIIEGVFENIDDKGNLILRVGSKKEIIDTGEIFS